MAHLSLAADSEEAAAVVQMHVQGLLDALIRPMLAK